MDAKITLELDDTAPIILTIDQFNELCDMIDTIRGGSEEWMTFHPPSDDNSAFNCQGD